MRLKLNKNEISKIAYQIGFDTPVSHLGIKETATSIIECNIFSKTK